MWWGTLTFPETPNFASDLMFEGSTWRDVLIYMFIIYIYMNRGVYISIYVYIWIHIKTQSDMICNQ